VVRNPVLANPGQRVVSAGLCLRASVGRGADHRCNGSSGWRRCSATCLWGQRTDEEDSQVADAAAFPASPFRPKRGGEGAAFGRTGVEIWQQRWGRRLSLLDHQVKRMNSDLGKVPGLCVPCRYVMRYLISTVHTPTAVCPFLCPYLSRMRAFAYEHRVRQTVGAASRRPRCTLSSFLPCRGWPSKAHAVYEDGLSWDNTSTIVQNCR